jgi:large subunit ribosomal protein L23
VVKKPANRVEVKKAVEKQYKVKVLNVNMINTRGKQKNFGRITGKTSPIRKAVVTLKKGESIKGLTEVA